jgi:predicted CXXCH cytochrome family protein
VKANFAATGHGQFPLSSECTVCHNADSAHISVSIAGASSRLNAALTGGLNAECAYCHNDAAKVSARFLNMSTHVTAKGGVQAMACSSCHDPHGTNNLSMIRTSINGQTITFTDREIGLIDATTNLGLCQVCHTLTTYYRAGVPESSHPTSNCLSCHPHNGAGGAFKPNGRCDACHGYPPAPRLATSPITFGTMNNWSSARFEDYSGGGGAHLVAKHVSPTANPSEGWANCAICHNGGRTDSAPYHRMTLPLSSHRDNVTIEIDPAYRFDSSFTSYTGAKLVNPPARNTTGSCFNISCHMSPSPRWSIER